MLAYVSSYFVVQQTRYSRAHCDLTVYYRGYSAIDTYVLVLKTYQVVATDGSCKVSLVCAL